MESTSGLYAEYFTLNVPGDNLISPWPGKYR